jgi:hypothetical protein
VTRPLHEFGWPRPASSDEFRITSPYGWRLDPLGSGKRVFHGGLDIGNGRLGYPVVAVAVGKVIASGFLREPWSQSSTRWPSGNFGGLCVIVEHASGVRVGYYHLRSRTQLGATVGARVNPGDVLGAIGDTGSAQGQGHLHLNLWRNMVLLDPEPHVRLGVPIATEGSDLVIFPAADVKLLNNVGCAIRAGSVVRSEPEINDATRLFATGTDQIGWRPTAQVTGETFNGSSAWYAGWLQVPGKGTALVFVHSARCTPLTPVENTTGADPDDVKAVRNHVQLAAAELVTVEEGLSKL